MRNVLSTIFDLSIAFALGAAAYSLHWVYGVILIIFFGKKMYKWFNFNVKF